MSYTFAHGHVGRGGQLPGQLQPSPLSQQIRAALTVTENIHTYMRCDIVLKELESKCQSLRISG